MEVHAFLPRAEDSTFISTTCSIDFFIFYFLCLFCIYGAFYDLSHGILEGISNLCGIISSLEIFGVLISMKFYGHM